VIIPLEISKIVHGYIMLGLNSRRAFDADHEQAITELARQLRALMAKITLEKNSQRRELDLKEELSATERRISQLAEVVPVGIYELNADGTLLWANTQFWELFELSHGQRDPKAFDWRDHIHPDDHARALGEMQNCLVQAEDISDTLRLKRRYQPPRLGHELSSSDEPFWLMYAASPHIKPDGTVHSLMGSLTDISHVKWSEQLQIRNAEAARKERKRQEEFIDITSHEMRNPLSAITQCADSVYMSLQDAQSQNDAQSLLEIVKLNAEAAESILFCAAHQRRIINDILLLGKLDSKLLTISPKAFNPQDLVNQILQMFGAECDANDIGIRTTVDTLSAATKPPTICADPSRLMQILVNLLSNAVKFVRSRPTREITIRYGCHASPPPEDRFGPNFKWYSTGTVRPDLTQEPEYGQADVHYLYYAVIDSGKGIKPEYVSNIFTKFDQAERRTHTEYGGSGLGLYISQELTELQGGRIGIDSEDGVGSTFAFYTKVRLSSSESATPIALMDHVYSVAKTKHVLTSVGSSGLSNGLAPPSQSLSANYSILLVEDNLLNQKVLTKQLRKAGCAVRICNHGGEAVDSILRLHNRPLEFNTPIPDDNMTHFDCILMDWEMPVCDGIKASRKIRAIEAEGDKQRNVIIGVTANARAEQIAMAERAGMNSVIPKPFRVAELLAKIRTCVAPPGSADDAGNPGRG
jgi:signal transduction histidine kinase/CheY-like chemotaxis protein/PAS domain-containing protein